MEIKKQNEYANRAVFKSPAKWEYNPIAANIPIPNDEKENLFCFIVPP